MNFMGERTGYGGGERFLHSMMFLGWKIVIYWLGDVDDGLGVVGSKIRGRLGRSVSPLVCPVAPAAVPLLAPVELYI